MRIVENWLVCSGSNPALDRRIYNGFRCPSRLINSAEPAILAPSVQELASNLVYEAPSGCQEISRMKRSLFVLWLGVALVSAGAWAQTCFTSDDMDAATRSALEATGHRYFEMVARGDAASLKANSIPAVASNFTGIEETIKENQSNLAGAHATPRDPFLLKAEGTTPLPRAEFLCGIFGANGQTKNSAEFIIPNLPPGSYGIVTLDVTTQKSPYTLAFVLEQQGTDWKIGNFFLRPTQLVGHDSNWFLEQARALKAKGQTHNAWLFFVQGRDLAMAVPFMYTQASDKLYDEAQSVKPTDFPVD